MVKELACYLLRIANCQLPIQFNQRAYRIQVNTTHQMVVVLQPSDWYAHNHRSSKLDQ